MKKWIIGIIAIVVTSCMLPAQSSKLEKSEVIKKELSISNPQEGYLLIRNITGGLDIQGYDGDKIMIEVKKTIKAKTESALQEGWAEADLGVVQKGDAVLLYQKTPCTNEHLEQYNSDDWGEWNMLYKNNCNWRNDYDLKLEFTVKVPRQMQLNVSTVNHGDIIVKNVSGKLKVNNVNGAITLEQIGGAAHAHTVNGDLTLSMVNMPKEDCYFYTLNGDINAVLPKGNSFNMYFKSYNGDFYTDIEDGALSPLPVAMEKAAENKKVKYKVGGQTGVKVRQGGVHLEFETFNGNAYVKEK